MAACCYHILEETHLIANLNTSGTWHYGGAFSRTAIAIGGILLVIPLEDAHAYIDPSSAILGLQALVAAVVSGVLWLGRPIKRIKDWIKRKKNTSA